MPFQMAINMAEQHNQLAPPPHVEISTAFTTTTNLSHNQCRFQFVTVVIKKTRNKL
jgi:hypothetical protein